MPGRLLPLLCLLVACGDDARLTDGSEHASTGDGDAAHVPTNPVSGAGLVYTFPCLGKREATYEATFASVYLDVFCGAGCVNPYCHGSRGTWGDLDLASSIEVAYSQLVEHRTGLSTPADLRPTCRDSDLLRVVPVLK